MTPRPRRPSAKDVINDPAPLRPRTPRETCPCGADATPTHSCQIGHDAMTAVNDDIFGTADIPRDRWKRPLVTPADGGDAVPYTRVSTFASTLEDAGGLTTWKARLAARGMACFPDLAAMVAGLTFADSGDKKADTKANRPSNVTLDEHIETGEE